MEYGCKQVIIIVNHLFENNFVGSDSKNLQFVQYGCQVNSVLNIFLKMKFTNAVQTTLFL